MQPDPDYYVVLGLRADASPQEVEEAYVLTQERAKARFARFFSPLSKFTPERVQAAYMTLSDPTLRAEYDKYLKVLCIWKDITPMS